MNLKLDDSSMNESGRSDSEKKTSAFNIQSDFLPEGESMADDDGYYHAPVRPVAPPPASTPKKQVHVPTFVIILLICAVIAVILKLVPFNQKTKLDAIVRLPQASIEEELGMTLEHNPDFVSRLSIPNNSPEGLDTYTNAKGSFSVIYYNGKQFGVSFSDSKYTLFGIKIGDSENHILNGVDSEDGIFSVDGVPVYEYTTFFTMLEDMTRSGSTAEYFLGKDGSVLVLVINDQTNRVVNIIYYYDSERVMEDISLF